MDRKLPLPHDFLELFGRRLAGHARLHGDQAVVVNVDHLFFQRGAAVTERIDHPTPVGIAPVPRAFHQHGVRHRFGSLPSILERRSATDLHLHEPADSFAILHDHARQIARDVVEHLLEPGEVVAAGSQRFTTHFAVGQRDDGVVGAHVAVHRDTVEALFHRHRQGPLQLFLVERGIGGQHAEHSGHVRIDHPRTLRHATQSDNPSVRQCFAQGKFLGERIGRHDSTRRRLGAAG